MPINEPEQMPFSPLLADILTANVKWSADLSDRVIDNKDREIAELQKNYTELWEAIDKANDKIDSLTLDTILAKHGMRVSRAFEALNNPHD